MGNNQSELISQLNTLCGGYYKECEAEVGDLTDKLLKCVSKYATKFQTPRLAYIRHKFFMYRTRTGIDDETLNKIEESILEIVKNRKSFIQLEPEDSEELRSKLGRFKDNLKGLVDGMNRYQSSLSEPHRIFRVTSEEFEEEWSDQDVSAIQVDESCVWIIKPAIGHLGSKVTKLIDKNTTLQEVQEIVDNIIARYLAKQNKTALPAKFFSESLDIDTPRTVTLVERTEQNESDILEKCKKLEASLIRFPNVPMIVTIPPLNRMNGSVSKLIDERFNGEYSESDLEEIQKIVDSVLEDNRAKRQAYRDYKESLASSSPATEDNKVIEE